MLYILLSGGNAFTTYSYVPYYMSSSGYALALDFNDYCVFDFTEDDQVTILLNTTSLQARFITGTLL